MLETRCTGDALYAPYWDHICRSTAKSAIARPSCKKQKLLKEVQMSRHVKLPKRFLSSKRETCVSEPSLSMYTKEFAFIHRFFYVCCDEMIVAMLYFCVFSLYIA